jgi:hypothetical protein
VRPTVPLSAWRLAVDLDATRSLRRRSGHPADGCECEHCAHWRKAADTAFPAAIAEQLKRLGVEPQRPTDLYVTVDSEPMRGFRVMYHVAGKILSGPAPWSDNDRLGTMHNYHLIQDAPTWVSLRVTTAKDSYAFSPDLPAGSTSDVLCLDFRLGVVRN